MALFVDVQTTRFGTVAVVGSQEVRLPLPPGGSLCFEPLDGGRVKAVLLDSAGRPTGDAEIGPQDDTRPITVTRGVPPD